MNHLNLLRRGGTFVSEFFPGTAVWKGRLGVQILCPAGYKHPDANNVTNFKKIEFTNNKPILGIEMVNWEGVM